MKKFTFVVLSILFFCNCRINHTGKQVMPVGEYKFVCATALIGSDIPLQGWSKINQFKNKVVIYQVKNDTTIEAGKSISKASKKNLIRVTQSGDATGFQKLPKQYLDFELQGVYHEEGHPLEYYSVLYYSRQRQALMRQYHSGLNNIDMVALFFSNAKDTLNPFVNYSHFFRMGSLNFRDTSTLKLGGPKKNIR